MALFAENGQVNGIVCFQT